METTLNVHNEIFAKITRAARLKDMSRSDVIIHLIKKTMDEIYDPVRIGKMIRYQNRCRPDEWHTFHIRLRMDDYEYFLDLRKLLKMSVSLILAYAVEKFLDEMLKKNVSDNYQYINYIVVKELIDNIISWKFIWGFTPKIIKQLNS
jgi:hypothetical protein